MTKECSKCKQMKDESKFSKRWRSDDGLEHWCKSCHSEYNKEHRIALAAKRREYKKEKAVYDKTYHKNHQEEIKTKHKQHYEEHREEHIAKVYKWQQENSKRFKEICMRAVTKRKRNLEWKPLYLNPFSACEEVNGHHVDSKYVVYLPEDLHQLGGEYSGTSVEKHRINLSYIIDQIYGGNEYGHGR